MLPFIATIPRAPSGYSSSGRSWQRHQTETRATESQEKESQEDLGWERPRKGQGHLPRERGHPNTLTYAHLARAEPRPVLSTDEAV